MPSWHCVKQCGACCKLTPEERPDLDQYLAPESLALYLSMVGPDGWCINFNQDQRNCNIYDDRPHFCRVQPDTFLEMFDVEADELDEFAIDCCREQIEDVYGDKSLEMLRFDREIGVIIQP
jgi:uncharacterized protein